jgi:hypothetical protein
MPDQPHPRRTLEDLGYKEEWSPFGDPDAQDPDPAVRRRFYGKYRGTVVNNEDPLFQGRLILNVPDAFGLLESNWALPCVPVTDIEMGTYTRPRIGANVWVEFEQGDPRRPIWVGAFWDAGGIPTLAKASAAVPPAVTVITLESGTSGIVVCDEPFTGGNVTLSAGEGTTTILLSPAGVIINAPTVSITADTSFTVDAPNFTVLP